MCSIKMAERSIGRIALSGGGFLLCPHPSLRGFLVSGLITTLPSPSPSGRGEQDRKIDYWRVGNPKIGLSRNALRARGANKGIWLKTVNFSLKFFPLFRVVLNGSENPAPTISRVFLDYMSNVTLARTTAIEFLR